MSRSIQAIDRDINELRRQRRGDPDFRTQETALFRERGFAQLERDQREYERAMSTPTPRRKRCPTCGR